jgi:hypothetical protein
MLHKTRGIRECDLPTTQAYPYRPRPSPGGSDGHRSLSLSAECSPLWEGKRPQSVRSSSARLNCQR